MFKSKNLIYQTNFVPKSSSTFQGWIRKTSILYNKSNRREMLNKSEGV